MSEPTEYPCWRLPDSTHQDIGEMRPTSGTRCCSGDIFDVVRDFVRDGTMEGYERVMNGYLKPAGLLILNDFGMKQLPNHCREYLFEIVNRPAMSLTRVIDRIYALAGNLWPIISYFVPPNRPASTDSGIVRRGES